jgi:hypothetical protein
MLTLTPLHYYSLNKGSIVVVDNINETKQVKSIIPLDSNVLDVLSRYT